MRDHNTPSSLLGHVAGFNTFGHRSDLVDLEQKSVTDLLFDSLLDSGWVSDKEVITDNLYFISHESCHLGEG